MVQESAVCFFQRLQVTHIQLFNDWIMSCPESGDLGLYQSQPVTFLVKVPKKITTYHSGDFSFWHFKVHSGCLGIGK